MGGASTRTAAESGASIAGTKRRTRGGGIQDIIGWAFIYITPVPLMGVKHYIEHATGTPKYKARTLQHESGSLQKSVGNKERCSDTCSRASPRRASTDKILANAPCDKNTSMRTAGPIRGHPFADAWCTRSASCSNPQIAAVEATGLTMRQRRGDLESVPLSA